MAESSEGALLPPDVHEVAEALVYVLEVVEDEVVGHEALAEVGLLERDLDERAPRPEDRARLPAEAGDGILGPLGGIPGVALVGEEGVHGGLVEDDVEGGGFEDVRQRAKVGADPSHVVVGRLHLLHEDARIVGSRHVEFLLVELRREIRGTVAHDEYLRSRPQRQQRAKVLVLGEPLVPLLRPKSSVPVRLGPVGPVVLGRHPVRLHSPRASGFFLRHNRSG
mmetsp:Transcript_20150/g.64899  ORF Transcript_20150/g.64899 Transcript_20150/m.64899 type:complete len:223 (+) Transcript_20150:36-704(+)